MRFHRELKGYVVVLKSDSQSAGQACAILRRHHLDARMLDEAPNPLATYIRGPVHRDHRVAVPAEQREMAMQALDAWRAAQAPAVEAIAGQLRRWALLAAGIVAAFNGILCLAGFRFKDWVVVALVEWLFTFIALAKGIPVWRRRGQANRHRGPS